jgi:hypothetical protein
MDEFPADIPLTPPAAAEGHPVERVKQP